MREFAAMVPVGGRLVEIRFDALDERDALNIAIACGAGLISSEEQPNASTPTAVRRHYVRGDNRALEPVAFDITRAREILGGISRATVYSWLALGRLERVPGTRRVLITRSSLERVANQV